MHRISADSRLSLGSLHRSFTKQLVSMPQEVVGFSGLTRMFHESKKAEGISKVKQRITPRLEVQYIKIQEGLPKQRCTSAWESHKLRDGGGFRAFEKMTRNTADVEFPLELFTDVSDLTSLQGRMEREDFKVYFVGVDEVGRGPLAGPVVAAACAMALHHREVLESTSNSSWYSRIQDSKKMRDSERKRCYEAIKCASLLPNPVVQIATAERSACEIDQTNILQCTLDCMVECAAKVIKSVLETNDAKLKSLKQSRKNRLCFVLLIDGNILPPPLKRSGPCDLILKELKRVKNPTRVQPDTVSEDVSTLHDSDTLSSDQSNEASFIALPIIQGDASCISIAAASIVAKEVRDEYMRELHLQYSQFGFDAHKGYPTPAHLQTLKKHAPCRDHRFSFAPVREASILHSRGEQDVC